MKGVIKCEGHTELPKASLAGQIRTLKQSIEHAGRRKAEGQEKGQDPGIKQSRLICTGRIMAAKQSAHCPRQTPLRSAPCRPHSRLIHGPPFTHSYE